MTNPDRMSRWSDDQILREANKGNEDAFLFFCGRVLPSLYRRINNQCRRYGISSDLAEDFCHDAVLKALNSIRQTVAIEVSEAWIFRIAVNILLDWIRREQQVSFVCDIEVQAKVEKSLEDLEELEEIRKFFNWLPDRERDMLELVLVDEKTIIEAGSQIGLSQPHSYKVYHAGLEKLRDLLVEHGMLPENSTLR